MMEMRTRGGSRATREAAKEATKVDPLELWKKYKSAPNKELRNRLMEHYFPLVKLTAERVFAKLPQNVDCDDLVSAGVFGLKDAIEGFDLARGVKFETYCTTRIRGAILDELRAFDWVPRLVRTKAHKLDAALRQLEIEHGRGPTDQETAKLLGLTHNEFDSLVKEATAVTMVSLSEKFNADEDETKQLRKIDILEDKRQDKPIEWAQRKDFLQRVVGLLAKKEKDILLLYYFEDMTMREIGLTLDLSESRVCQLHTRIMDRLRSQLGKVKQDLLA